MLNVVEILPQYGDIMCYCFNSSINAGGTGAWVNHFFFKCKLLISISSVMDY